MATAFEAGSGRRRIAALAEWAGEAVVALDRQGRVERWNPGAERLYGYAPTEATGRSLSELLGAELPAAAPDGSLRDFAGRHHRRDGHAIEVVGTVWPVTGEAGRLTGGLVVVRPRAEADALARQVHEEALQLWEAQEMAQLGTWAWQPGSKTLVWNDAQHRIFGTDPATFVPSVEEYIERLHPDDRERVLDGITAALTGGDSFDHQERIVRPDGEIRHVRTRGRVVAGSGAGGLRMIGVTHDITDQVAGQEQLRDAVERLEEAQEIGRIGSWEWDIPANRLTWSSVLYDIYGVDAESFEASYDAYLALIDEADRERVDRAIRAAIEDRRPFEFTHGLARPDGAARTLHCRGRVVTDAAGRPVRLAGTAHDITEQREAERRLAVADAQLELTRRMANLLSITEAALSHLALDDLLPQLLERICAALSLDQAEVFLLEPPGTLRLRASRGIDGPDEVELEPGEGFAGRVIVRGEPLLLGEADEIADTAVREHAAGLRSLAGVPLVVDDEVVGALCVGSRARDGFSDDALALLRLAAQRAAIAIQHGRLYERERRIAETLQRSLLPAALPSGEAVAVEARYLPATGEVGGDWYDAIPLDDHVLGIALGDVSGHGIRAAALMAELRHSLSAYACDGHPPAEVANRLDALMRRRGHDQIATLLYGELSEGGRLRCVSAGHLPPLVVDADGVRFLELAPGPPLGCGAVYAEREAELAPGSLLVLYSDGLVERRAEVIDRGLERLAAAAQAGPREPDALCAHLVAALVPPGGGDDDVAVVVAQPGGVTSGALAGAQAPPRAASRAARR